jgi:hypothetical protein
MRRACAPGGPGTLSAFIVLAAGRLWAGVGAADGPDPRNLVKPARPESRVAALAAATPAIISNGVVQLGVNP